MAARINTRFVLTLAVVLGFVCAVLVATYYLVVLRSSERLEKMADVAMTKGELDRAITIYGKAYHKDPSNISALHKYKDAILTWEPASEADYRDAASRLLRGAVNQIAQHETESADAQAELAEVNYEFASSFFPTDTDAWAQLETDADRSIAGLETATIDRTGVDRMRGYRALGVVRQRVLGGVVDDRRTQQALADLEAATAAAPEDIRFAQTLAVLRFSLADEALRSNRNQECRDHWTAGVAAVESFVARNPTNAAGKVLLEMGKVQAGRALATIDQAPTEHQRLQEQALAQRKEPVAALLRDLLASDVSSLTPETFDGLRRLEASILRQGITSTNAIANRLVDARPNDSAALLTAAGHFLRSAQASASIPVFDRILQLREPKVSIKGLLLLQHQLLAHLGKTEAQFGMAMGTTDPAERAKRIAELEASIADMQRTVTAEPALELTKGRLLLAKDDLVGAQRALRRYNELVADQDASGIALEAETLLRDNKPAQAVERLRQAVRADPSSQNLKLRLADMLFSAMRRGDEAAAIYQEVLNNDPTNTEASTRLAVVRSLRGEGTTGNPIDDLFNRATQLATENNVPQAMAMLEDGVKQHGPDPKLSLLLAQLLLQSRDDQPAAVAVLQRSLDANPGNEGLANALQIVRIADPVDRTLKLIEVSGRDDATKMAERQRVLAQAGRAADAEAALRELSTRFPEHPRAIEARFDAAIAARRFDEAQSIADAAGKLNVDRVEGRYFRALVADARGDTAAAGKLLDEAIASGSNVATHHLFRGQLHARGGDLGRAREAFARAYQLNPLDRRVVMAHVSALRQDGQRSAALAVARESRGALGGDGSFMNMLLGLEYEAGNVDVALREREAFAQRDSANSSNNLALSAIYLDQRRPSDAKLAMERVDAEMARTPEVVALRAQIAAALNDTAGAKAVFEDMITRSASSDGPARLRGYASYAQFLSSTGDVDGALAVMDRAAREVPSERASAELAKGSILHNAGRFDSAVQTLRPVVSGGGAAADEARPLLVAGLLATGKQAEALAALDGLGNAVNENLQLGLLRSETLASMSKWDEARAQIDRLTAAHGTNPRVFIARGRLNLRQPETVGDALSDFDQALKLSPGMVDALRLRAAAASFLGRFDDLRRDAEAMVRIDAQQRVAMPSVVERMITAGRETDARTLADDLMRVFPDDVSLAANVAQAFAQHGRWADAGRYIRQGIATGKALNLLPLAVEAALSATPPDIRAARELLGRQDVRVDSNPILLVQRARVLRMSNEPERAEQDARLAIVGAKDNPELLTVVLDRLRSMYESDRPGLRAMLGRLGLGGLLTESWASYAMVSAADEGDQAALAELQRLMGQQDPAVADAAITETIRRLEKSDRALLLPLLEKRLALYPDSAALHNDYAFLLARYGGSSQAELDRALSSGQRALAALPGNSSVLDTVGFVHLRRGELDQAEEKLSLALQSAATTRELTVTLLHIGQLRQKQGRSVAPILRWLDRELASQPDLAEQFSAEMTELRRGQ